MTIGIEKRRFFVTMGERIAQLRNMTQARLAISRLPRARRRFVTEFLQAVLAQAAAR